MRGSKRHTTPLEAAACVKRSFAQERVYKDTMNAYILIEAESILLVTIIFTLAAAIFSAIYL